jgi:hypothetical protein
MSPDDLPKPRLTFAFEARVEVDPLVYVGGSGADALLFFPICGGTVRCPRLNGDIISGGGDWATGSAERCSRSRRRSRESGPSHESSPTRSCCAAPGRSRRPRKV